MCGATAEARRDGRDRHGGTGPIRLVRQLRASVPRGWRDSEGVESSRGERGAVPQALRNRRADELRGDLHLAEEEDRRAAQRHIRRGDDRILRQVGALARGAFGPSTLARDRPSRNLSGENRAGRPNDSRVGRAGNDLPDGDVQLFGHPGREADEARRRDRRRLHRTRDDGEPRPSRLRRDARGDARSDPGPPRPGGRPPCRGPPDGPWRPPGAR